MQAIQTHMIDCPCCGENIELVIDCSVSHQEYVEDCSVCCRPIIVSVECTPDGAIVVEGRSESE
jgi:hypothetical protein